MGETVAMHPFVRVMQRYIEDYCNRHDMSVCLEIMDPSYVVHIAGRHHMGRDEFYIPAASAAFGRFPDLRLTVHELHTNGDRLVMRFSERGHHGETGNLACWGGIGLYDWNGSTLTTNWVEQDYLSRLAQVEGRSSAHELDTPASDPWSVGPVPADPVAERIGRDFLQRGNLLAAASVVVDDSWLHGPASLPIVPIEVRVDDLFSIGPIVAGHVQLADRDGRVLNVSAILRTDGSKVTRVRAVTDRLGLAERDASG